MAPKKKEQSRQWIGAIPEVVITVVPDGMSMHIRREGTPTTPLTSSTVETLIENVQMPPLTDTRAPPLNSFFSPSTSDGDIRGAIQLLTQIVTSQDQR